MPADEVLRSTHEGKWVCAHPVSECVAPTGPNSQAGASLHSTGGESEAGGPGVDIAQGHTGPLHVPLQG